MIQNIMMSKCVGLLAIACVIWQKLYVNQTFIGDIPTDESSHWRKFRAPNYSFGAKFIYLLKLGFRLQILMKLEWKY